MIKRQNFYFLDKNKKRNFDVFCLSFLYIEKINSYIKNGDDTGGVSGAKITGRNYDLRRKIRMNVKQEVSVQKVAKASTKSSVSTSQDFVQAKLQKS